MSAEVLKTRVDELEVSVRTSDFLGSLGVITLGELLGLPEIRVPDTTRPKMAAMMLAELRDLFESLGVTYSGILIGPPLREATLTATGEVPERWRTIATWLADEHPHALKQFNPPAAAEAIAAAERDLGFTLPDDYKQFLAIHNGQTEFAAMVGRGSLLPVEKIAEIRNGIFGEEIAVDEAGVGEGVRAVDYCPGWIPISKSASGRNYLCIDLDPASNGTSGQIIEYVVDFDARPLIAKSFADLLSLYFAKAQTGEVDLDEDAEEH